MSQAIPRETGVLEHDGERLYWERLGVGPATPLVLCHGLGGNHAVWFQQVAFFAATRPVVVWDHRGFGRSTDRAGASGPEPARGDLAALLDHLDLDRIDLVGQSMGGWTALGFAIDQPRRVRRLVLADSLGGVHDATIEAAQTADRERHGPLELAAPVLLGHHPAIDARFRERDPDHAWLYQAIGGMGEPDGSRMIPRLVTTRIAAAEVGALPFPVLLIVGEHDRLFPPSVVRVAAARFGDARVVEIEGSGHSPYFEAPRAWNQAVARFIDDA